MDNKIEETSGKGGRTTYEGKGLGAWDVGCVTRMRMN